MTESKIEMSQVDIDNIKFNREVIDEAITLNLIDELNIINITDLKRQLDCNIITHGLTLTEIQDTEVLNDIIKHSLKYEHIKEYYNADKYPIFGGVKKNKYRDNVRKWLLETVILYIYKNKRLAPSCWDMLEKKLDKSLDTIIQKLDNK